jgi:leucyl aminopeptidase
MPQPAITFELSREIPAQATVMVDGVAKGAELPADVAEHAATVEFDGKAGHTLRLPGRLLVGLGEVGDDGPSSAVLRRAAVAAARALKKETFVATTLPPTQAVAEGFVLGSYTFDKYKSDAKPSLLERVVVIGGGGARARAALDRGARIATAVGAARDLVNEPGGSMVPEALADGIAALARTGGIAVTVHDAKSIGRLGYAGLQAVNRGSARQARFVELTYEPEGRARGTLALVGKGITFDSGGLSLKPSASMTTMKNDMAGAAAVAAAVSAARDLGLKTRVRAFLPITDNMTGGDAQRVGDIITYANDKTVEVLNTDAEGRLVLADGLIAAAGESPDAIVDVATLTGAAMVALGSKVAAVLSNDDGFVEQVKGAAEAADEPMWQLPLHTAYRKDLDSKIADLKNIGGAHGGTITAALFLNEFVGDTPWAHLDIAGPAFTDSEDADNPAGATGYAVRTLIQLMTTFTKPR